MGNTWCNQAALSLHLAVTFRKYNCMNLKRGKKDLRHLEVKREEREKSLEYVFGYHVKSKVKWKEVFECVWVGKQQHWSFFFFMSREQGLVVQSVGVIGVCNAGWKTFFSLLCVPQISSNPWSNDTATINNQINLCLYSDHLISPFQSSEQSHNYMPNMQIVQVILQSCIVLFLRILRTSIFNASLSVSFLHTWMLINTTVIEGHGVAL